MTSVDFVQDASDKVLWLVGRECRGSRDTDRAMHRVASDIGVPYSQLYNLRYRPPRDILTNIYFKICMAYDREVERQARLSRHGDQINTARTGAGRTLLRWALTLDRVADAIDGGSAPAVSGEPQDG